MQLHPDGLKAFAATHLNMPIFYVVPDIHWALGLEDILPHYHIVCADTTWAVDQLRHEGKSVFCADTDAPRQLAKRSSSGLLDLAAVQSFIRGKSAGALPHILVFKPAPAIEKRCRELAYRLLAPASGVNRKYEDKLAFSRFLAEHALPRPDTVLGRMPGFDWKTLVQQLGPKVVLQTARGFAGSSTAMIDSEAGFDRFRREHPANEVKASRHVEGIPLTLNACVLPDWVLFSRPFYQITGLPAYNRYPGGTCGNDYGFDYGWDADLQAQTQRIVETIGSSMRADGYLGVFGLDLVLADHDRRLLVIENNARLVASIPFFTKLQRRSGQVPLLLLHILLHAGVPFDLDGDAAQAALLELPAAAQLILRNVTGHTVRVTGSLPTGIYDQALTQISATPESAGLGDATHLLLQTAAPDRMVNPNMEYANMQWLNSVTASPGQLKPQIDTLAQAIRQILIKQ